MTSTPGFTPRRYLAAIEATYSDLDGWRQRAREQEAPQRASELANDDMVFPPFRVSEVGRLGLMSAGEHLRLVRDGLAAGNVYPSASHTTLRGALVGAAQAVWILAPDNGETRQQRALTAVHANYKQLRTYDNDVKRMRWLSRDDRAELGAESFKPKGQGKTDSAWLWSSCWIALEAKSDEGAQGPVSQNDVRQANDQLITPAADQGAEPPERSIVVIVTPRELVDPTGALVARPFVYYTSLSAVRDLAHDAVSAWRQIRVEVSGQQEDAIRTAIRAAFSRHGILLSDVRARLARLRVGD